MQVDAGNKPELPSIHDSKPSEEGGPVARIGFNYQDEIAVSLLLEMLESPKILSIHCETHDDALVVFEGNDVEYVQVKSNDSLPSWTLSALSGREAKKVGSSIFEKSLARDAFKEDGSFRIISLKDVTGEIALLKHPLGKPGRESDHPKVIALCAELEKRCPGAKSAKGNGSSYWLGRCKWDVRESEAAVATQNLFRLYKISVALGFSILLEPLEVVLQDLRKMAKMAGDAKWEPDKDKKIIKRNFLLDWLKGRLESIVSAAEGASGGKLSQKMSAAGLSQDLIRIAGEMRRRYVEEVRSPRYMQAEDIDGLQRKVRLRVHLLQTQREGREVTVADARFHSMCVESARLTATGDEDQSDFQVGCMYDITDRCLLRFTTDKE